MQDQRAGKAGAVLAGGAVDHQRRAVFQQMRKQRAETMRVEPDIAAIGLAHDLERVAGRQRARLKPRPQRRHDRRLDRQRMHVDLLDDAGRGCALLGAAKIEGAA